MQAFIKLRNAIFAEDGYCLEAPIADMQCKDASIALVSLEKVGDQFRAKSLDYIREGAGGLACVNLLPYPDAEKALVALLVMESKAPAALDGDEEAKQVLGAAWRSMATKGLCLESRDEKTQMQILCNLFGRGRVTDELNRKGTVIHLTTSVDWSEMVDEALGRAVSACTY